MTGSDRRGGGSSFLVRLWQEPRGAGGAAGPARVYVRHLRSGDERYLKSIEDLVDFLARQQELRGGNAPRESSDAANGRRHAG